MQQFIEDNNLFLVVVVDVLCVCVCILPWLVNGILTWSVVWFNKLLSLEVGGPSSMRSSLSLRSRLILMDSISVPLAGKLSILLLVAGWNTWEGDASDVSGSTFTLSGDGRGRIGGRFCWMYSPLTFALIFLLYTSLWALTVLKFFTPCILNQYIHLMYQLNAWKYTPCEYE